MQQLFSSVQASWRNPVTRRLATATDDCRVVLSENYVSEVLGQALLQVYADTREVTIAVNNIITYATLDKAGKKAPAAKKVFQQRPDGTLLVYAKVKWLVYCICSRHEKQPQPMELRADKDYCVKSRSSDPTSQHIMVCGVGR